MFATMFNFVIALLFGLQGFDTPNIHLTLQTAEENAAIVGITVQFVDEAGVLSGSCVSDNNGRCNIQLSGQPANDVIRGHLDLGSSGTRSLIWNASEDVELTLYFDAYGHVLIPGHHVHPTVEVFTEPPTPLPDQQPADPPTTRPTTEVVVIDPETTLLPSVTPLPIIIPTLPEQSPTAILTIPPTDDTPTNETPPLWQSIACISLFVLIWTGGVIYIWRKTDA